jgi:hypothetical protein
VAFQQKEKGNYLKFPAKPIVAFLVVAVVNFKTVLKQTKAFYFRNRKIIQSLQFETITGEKYFATTS